MARTCVPVWRVGPRYLRLGTRKCVSTYADVMHVLVATAGALSPDPVVEFTRHLIGGTGLVTVVTVVEVPHSFLENLESDDWHPLQDDQPRLPDETLAAKYLSERGHRLTDPIRQALETARIPCDVTVLEGADPAAAISAAAEDLEADVVLLGATKQIFDRDAWESVSARVMIESGRPVLVVPEARKEPTELDDAGRYEPVVDASQST
jgi:nucleotide-binding universal stress UspA family protein